jgi:hypothetical protein
MADTFETNPISPLSHAVPVLELADPPPEVILDALPAGTRPEPPLEVLPGDVPRPPNPVMAALRLTWRCVRAVGSLLEWLFGLAVLMVGLAVLAALPVLQFLSLGYLLESAGRVARTGRLRDGFIGVRLAARLGGIVLGCWLFLWPARVVADLAYSAQIIDPGGRTAAGWRIGLFVLIGLTAFHIGTACALGGRLRYFFCPFNFILVLLRVCRGGYYAQARDAVWDTTMSLRLPYYFWLGFRGFVGALAWLAVPVSMLALGRAGTPGAALLGFLGALLLGLVLLYLPFLQTRLAMSNRLSAVFDLPAARAEFRRAPWAFAFSFVVTLLFALPLYLLKIEMVPREAAWLPSLVFISFIFPARLLTGWALGRAVHRPTPRHWFFRWTGRLPFLPAAGFYVLIVFFTQYTSWNGVWSLYEQHAFLVPMPFFGM